MKAIDEPRCPDCGNREIYCTCWERPIACPKCGNRKKDCTCWISVTALEASK